MTARCKIISDCQSCDFAQYQSGGRYRCATAKIDLPGIGRPAEPPDWCPLPVYRAALAQQAAASGDAFEGLTLDQVKANLSLLKEDDLRGLVVSLLIQQRIAERAFAATQPCAHCPDVVTITPQSMRQAVAQCEIELGGDWCETCPTVDACRIRGSCSPFLGKR